MKLGRITNIEMFLYKLFLVSVHVFVLKNYCVAMYVTSNINGSFQKTSISPPWRKLEVNPPPSDV
jgi:hypothetical protein